MTKSPRLSVEQWLTESLTREIYQGTEVSERLLGISENLSGDEHDAQDFIRVWLSEIDNKSFVGSIKVMNKLIDLWGHVTHYAELKEAMAEA